MNNENINKNGQISIPTSFYHNQNFDEAFEMNDFFEQEEFESYEHNEEHVLNGKMNENHEENKENLIISPSNEIKQNHEIKATNEDEEYIDFQEDDDKILDEEAFKTENEQNILNLVASQTVEEAKDLIINGEVSECLAELPNIIENYKKEKVIKEHVKNLFYDEAIELAENSLDTFAGEENNENIEILEKKVHIHSFIGKKLVFDEEYENEGYEF